MSSRPSLKYNSINKRWEVRGKGGQLIASFGDDGNVKSPITLEVGETGQKVSRIYGFVATLVNVLAVASGALGIGTLQSVTGSGVGCAELAVGDMVFGVPKIAPDSIVFGGFHIPTTNTLNVYAHTVGEDQGGSLAPGAGFDIVAIRMA